MAGSPPSLPLPPPPPEPLIVDVVSEKMSVMAQRDSAAATEAVRVIGLLLARPSEPDRLGHAQRAAACARASAEATSTIAATLGTESTAIEAEIASSLASHAEQLLALF